MFTITFGVALGIVIAFYALGFLAHWQGRRERRLWERRITKITPAVIEPRVKPDLLSEVQYDHEGVAINCVSPEALFRAGRTRRIFLTLTYAGVLLYIVVRELVIVVHFLWTTPDQALSWLGIVCLITMFFVVIHFVVNAAVQTVRNRRAAHKTSN